MGELNRQQLCAKLGISESTVRRLELDGLPYTPIGSRGKRYDLAECKAWLRENKCQPGSIGTAADMLASCSKVSASIASFPRPRLRVMPSKSKRRSEVA